VTFTAYALRKKGGKEKMKTINVSSKSDIQTFTDDSGNYSGFAGTVLLYNLAIYIDTRDGTGFENAIEILNPLIHRLMSKFYFSGNSREDTKQDIILHILEGIPKYDPRKGVKLSTFIEMRVNRRLINELRDKSRIYKNATFLNISSFNFTCECGNNFTLTVNNNDNRTIICNSCSNEIKIKKKVSVNTPEVNDSDLFRQLRRDNDQNEAQKIDELSLDDYSIVGNRQCPLDEEIIIREDVQTLINESDPTIAKMLDLIYFHDYSITSAAEEVGMSSAGANIKLKRLRRKKSIRDVFNR